MRSLTCLVVGITLLEIASACCQVKKIGRCCGKGKCNIFCCNCDGGCLATDVCSYRQCETACSKKSTSPPVLAACIAKCYFGVTSSLASEGQLLVEVSTTPQHALSVFKNSGEVKEEATTDEELFYQVDKENKGFFTYEQFLVAMDWKDSEESIDHFESFDRNGDGKITVDEMKN